MFWFILNLFLLQKATALQCLPILLSTDSQLERDAEELHHQSNIKPLLQSYLKLDLQSQIQKAKSNLQEMGIKYRYHTEPHPYYEILRDGSHRLNVLASKLGPGQKMFYDPIYLYKNENLIAAYIPLIKTIYLPHLTILTGKIDGIVLHEIGHAQSNQHVIEGIARTLNGYYVNKNLSTHEQHFEHLASYRFEMTLDEVRSYKITYKAYFNYYMMKKQPFSESKLAYELISIYLKHYLLIMKTEQILTDEINFLTSKSKNKKISFSDGPQKSIMYQSRHGESKYETVIPYEFVQKYSKNQYEIIWESLALEWVKHQLQTLRPWKNSAKKDFKIITRIGIRHQRQDERIQYLLDTLLRASSLQ